MRNHHARILRSLFPAFALAATVGCSSPPPSFTVGGKKLIINETNYWRTDPNTNSAPYCQILAPVGAMTGQFEIIISDFPLFVQIHNKASNATIFHSSDEMNLRMIIPFTAPPPAYFKKNANGSFMTNTFAVAATNLCSRASGQPATAIFAHNSNGQPTYDLQVEADSGSIGVTAYDGTQPAPLLNGTYDLNFGADHIVGIFEATYLAGLTAEYGR